MAPNCGVLALGVHELLADVPFLYPGHTRDSPHLPFMTIWRGMSPLNYRIVNLERPKLISPPEELEFMARFSDIQTSTGMYWMLHLALL